MRGSMAVGAAIGALVSAGCGPAPYTIGPEEPGEYRPPPSSGAAVVLIPEAKAPAPSPRGEPEDRWIPDGLPRPNPFADHRTWIGAYDCPQGRTALTVRVVDVRGLKVRAIFDFHHAATDVSGQFIMAGTFDEQNGGVAFVPGVWIIHPDDYVTVGMVGNVSRDGTRFGGRIVAEGCGGFQLRAAR